jgi:hypothetical protein
MCSNGIRMNEPEQRKLTRYVVEQKDPLKGWDIWVIYDQEEFAKKERDRRIDEAPQSQKKNWRYRPALPSDRL